jgi:hypothetical protein
VFPGLGEISGLTCDLSRVGVSVLLPVPLPEGTRMVLRRPGFVIARPIYVIVVRRAQREEEVFL